MGDPTNINIGACSVNFKGVDLGHTKGGVTVMYNPEYATKTADQYGNTPLDKNLIGEDLRVRVPLEESQVANLAKMIPLGTLDGAGDGRLTIGKDAGASLLAQAGQLVLHPLVNSAGDLSQDVVLHKAVVDSSVEIPFLVDDYRVSEVEFAGLIDTSKSSNNYLGFIGDSTD